jgi:hypothetical protein
VNKLEKEETQGRAGACARQLTQMDAVVLDELRYLPFPEFDAAGHARSLTEIKQLPQNPGRFIKKFLLSKNLTISLQLPSFT